MNNPSTEVRGLRECVQRVVFNIACVLKLAPPFTALSSSTIAVAWTTFLFSTCTEGQTSSLQPAGIVFMMLWEETKLHSRGTKGRTGQKPKSLLFNVSQKYLKTSDKSSLNGHINRPEGMNKKRSFFGSGEGVQV